MRPRLRFAAAFILLAGCGESDTNGPIDPGPSNPAVVSMPGFSFSPFRTTISRGGTVTYDFPAQAHNVIFTRLTGAPADIQATSNQRVTRTFNTAGTFPFDCTLHPGMSGEVLVQ